MSHEKQWNDLHIYVKSGVIVYPQPRIHKVKASARWPLEGPVIIIIIINHFYLTHPLYMVLLSNIINYTTGSFLLFYYLFY